MIRIPSGFFEYIISILIPTGDTNAYKHQLENIYIYLVIFMKLLFFQSLNHGWLSCNTIDYGLPGSVHGISQARRLEWVAISFSRGSSQPRDRTHVSCIGRQTFYHWATRESLTSHSKLLVKTTVRHHITPLRWPLFKKQKIIGVGKYLKKLESLCTDGKNVKCWNLWKIVWRFLKKLVTTNPTLRYTPKSVETGSQCDIHIQWNTLQSWKGRKFSHVLQHRWTLKTLC